MAYLVVSMKTKCSRRAEAWEVYLVNNIDWNNSNQGCSQKSGDGGAKSLDRKPHLLINAEKEVIIIACAFQQIIRILSNINEQRNVDEFGVTAEVTGASYSLGRSEQT